MSGVEAIDSSLPQTVFVYYMHIKILVSEITI